MSLRHWVWLAAGMLLWAGLVLLWSTGPYDCTPPDSHHRVMCR